MCKKIVEIIFPPETNVKVEPGKVSIDIKGFPVIVKVKNHIDDHKIFDIHEKRKKIIFNLS